MRCGSGVRASKDQHVAEQTGLAKPVEARQLPPAVDDDQQGLSGSVIGFLLAGMTVVVLREVDTGICRCSDHRSAASKDGFVSKPLRELVVAGDIGREAF